MMTGCESRYCVLSSPDGGMISPRASPVPLVTMGPMEDSTTVTIITAPCWKCGKDMLVAMVGEGEGPSQFTDSERRLAQRDGVLLKNVQSKTANERALLTSARNADRSLVSTFYLMLSPLSILASASPFARGLAALRSQYLRRKSEEGRCATQRL